MRGFVLLRVVSGQQTVARWRFRVAPARRDSEVGRGDGTLVSASSLTVAVLALVRLAVRLDGPLGGHGAIEAVEALPEKLISGFNIGY